MSAWTHVYQKIQSYQCLVWLVLGKRAATAVKQGNFNWEYQLTVKARSLEDVFATRDEFPVS
jgi:uncharacterized membrane protein YfbV (UPF0208 family)